MDIITIKELENIILESDKEKEKECIFSNVVLENKWFSYDFLEFKKHNRLDCTAWLAILPYDFKIYLSKDNVITKAPFGENKLNRVLGKKLIFN